MLSIGCVQFVAGLLLLVGLFIRFAAAAATVLLVVAAFTLRANGFDWTHGGFEYATLWAAACMAIYARGAGALSADHACDIEI